MRLYAVLISLKRRKYRPCIHTDLEDKLNIIVVIMHLDVYRKHSQLNTVMVSACPLVRDSAIPYEQP